VAERLSSFWLASTDGEGKSSLEAACLPSLQGASGRAAREPVATFSRGRPSRVHTGAKGTQAACVRPACITTRWWTGLLPARRAASGGGRAHERGVLVALWKSAMCMGTMP
jgi:hypothetical protein